MDIQKITTQCCIAGGGPAGIMLGFLLARAGIETTVLEKWPDFFRDFRGDTIHPSTMEVLNELGILQNFLKLPHNKTYQMVGEIGTHKVVVADFSKLHVQCPYIAFIPQWDFLNFIVSEAKQLPHFHLMMNTEVTDVITDKNNLANQNENKNNKSNLENKNDKNKLENKNNINDKNNLDNQSKIVGVKAKNKDSQFEIYADLVVAADGRHSTVRERSLLVPKKLSVPMDVLWFKLPRKPTDPKQTLGKIDSGKIIIMLERGDYWQCGFLIRKGQYNEIVKSGLDAFHKNLKEVLPNLDESINSINNWEQIKLLQVSVERLDQWYKPGLLCIGDAAHTMSPIGGVGINLAIQDAVASANILVPAFQNKILNETHLQAIQKRREFPTRVIQRMQVFIQNRVIDHVLGNPTHPELPFPLKLLQRFPVLRRIPAYIIGIGVRPEHVKYKL